ncbi:MAG: ribosomal protein S18-alanine N-acetyltransferase [Rhodoferax sp.]
MSPHPRSHTAAGGAALGALKPLDQDQQGQGLGPEHDGDRLALEPLLAPWLDRVLAIELRAWEHPWGAAQFLDALHSGYQGQLLLCRGAVLGYFVAMQGVEEAHLLNITVAPEHQGYGHAHRLMQALHAWARAVGAQRVWLEVRVGNVRAIRLYERHGYREVGRRKAYYPAHAGQREDALVMCCALEHTASVSASVAGGGA